MRRAPRAVLGDRLPRSARSGRGTLDSGGTRERHYAARQCRASPRKCEARPWSIVWGRSTSRTELKATDVEGIDLSRRRDGLGEGSNAARARPAGRSRTPPAFQLCDAAMTLGDRASSRSDDPPHPRAARRPPPRAHRLEGLAPGGARGCGLAGSARGFLGLLLRSRFPGGCFR